MPKRGKEPRPSSRHSGGRFSPPPPPPSRQSRNDYQVAGPSRSTSDSSSGRRSPHSKDIIKISNGNGSHGNSSNRMLMNVVNSPIILTDDDDGDDDYKNVDTSMNIFRENGNKLNSDTGECTRLVKHFVPSADRYHMSQSAPEKPMFRGPETDVLHELEKDKLKNIRVQMIRADIQQNDCFRKAYVVEEPVAANRSKGDKNHQNFDDRQTHFTQNQMHYDNDKNYGMSHQLNSPRIISSRDRSLSPHISNDRPPSPPQPYSPERDHFNSDNMLRRDRKRSPDRIRERSPRPDHFMDQHKIDNFSSGPPPEPRSPPDMQHFRSSDHNSRHRSKDESIHYENRSRRSGSPVYFENQYLYRSPSPNIRPFSPNHLSMSQELSPPPQRDRPTHSNDRPRRRRMTPPPRRDRSRERRRRLSPRRRTPPLTRLPIKRKENGKKRPNKNQEARKREAKDRKRRSESKSKSSPQQEQQTSFQQPQQQPMYPPPPPGVVRMPPPPRPFPPGPMMIPMRPPPFPPPMGGWRPPRPPMQAPPPSGWPYPRPRPFYFPY